MSADSVCIVVYIFNTGRFEIMSFNYDFLFLLVSLFIGVCHNVAVELLFLLTTSAKFCLGHNVRQNICLYRKPAILIYNCHSLFLCNGISRVTVNMTYSVVC